MKSLKSEKQNSEFSEFLKKIRSKSSQEILLDEIANEVEEVRRKRSEG